MPGQRLLFTAEHLGDEITEEDEYSPDLERRRLFWLDSAKQKVAGFLEGVGGEFSTVEARLEHAFKKGDEMSLIHFPLAIPAGVDRDRAENLVKEIRSINREKGFRFGSSFITGREHAACGSSGFGRYADIDPDVPVPILRARLIEQGERFEDMPEEERNSPVFTMTVEEVDRARRLAGKTRLDLETGRVTREIDEAAGNDPYFFLAEERREEIMERERTIMNELVDIAARYQMIYEENCRNILRDLARYADGELLTPEMYLRLAEMRMPDSKRFPLDIGEETRMAKSLSFERGKRDHILTPQEILLRKNGRVDPRYLGKPYVPLALQMGRGYTVEQIELLRAAEGSMLVTTEVLGYEKPTYFKLENLNSDGGETVRSPEFLLVGDDGKLGGENDRFKEYFKYKITGFPFQRKEDWFYRPASGVETLRAVFQQLTAETMLPFRELTIVYLQRVLEIVKGNLAEAARLTGIKRTAFYYKLKALGIERGKVKKNKDHGSTGSP